MKNKTGPERVDDSKGGQQHMEELKIGDRFDGDGSMVAALLNCMDDLIAKVDDEGLFLYANDTAHTMLGPAPGSLLGKSVFDFVHHDDHAQTRKEFADRLTSQARISSFNSRMMSLDGQPLYTQWISLLQKTEEGSRQEVWLTIRDLTRQKQAEALQLLSSELTTIMDALPGLVFYKDTENRYIRVNKYVADAHKMAKEELEDRNCFDIYPHDQAQAYLDDDLKVIRSGEPKLNFVEPWDTEKGRRWVSTSKIPYVDDSGRIIGVIGVAMDITEQKLAEEALARKSQISEAVNRIFREALTCETEEELAQSALRVVEKMTDSRLGFVGEINRKGLFDTIALSNPSWDKCSIGKTDAPLLIKDMELRGIWAFVLKSGSAQIINSPSTHPAQVGIPAGHPELLSFLGVPFIHNGRPVGMIALANKEGGYDDNDRDAVETLAAAFYETLLRKRMEVRVRTQSRIKEVQAELSRRMSGDPEINQLCHEIVSYLCTYLNAPAGLMYVADAQGTMQLTGSHGYKREPGRTYEYRRGEGLVGQAALDKKVAILEDVPREYFAIESGLGKMVPRIIYINPIVYNNRARAVLELGFIRKPDVEQSDLLEALNESIAAAVESAHARRMQAQMLEESQMMTEELQSQQEELKTTNEELEEQTRRLRDSEARLQAQQEELQVTNEELEEKTEMLERQKEAIEQARNELAEKATDLETASKYKSEFLANMSHELRSPLNSLLLLARSLSENKQGNLSEDQVESAQIIYQGGNDLLALINDILDLSKIEAGKMDLRFGEVYSADLARSIRQGFEGLARHKGVELEVVTRPDAPEYIVSDRKRVEQVLKNVVANALKFTEKGTVHITLGTGKGNGLSVAVLDTGIGIPLDQHKAIFEAFQQGDGSTARKFGGTGLGLSIVSQLLKILGGKIDLRSQPGKGATFTIWLPKEGPHNSRIEKPPEPEIVGENQIETAPVIIPGKSPDLIVDDREGIKPQERSVLIIEDDYRFAGVLAGHCREQGFKVLASSTGEDGIALARQFIPSGVILDLKLPGMDGWRVLEVLKENPKTRHIPVHIASVTEPTMAAFHKGAIGYLQKPLTLDDIDKALNKMTEISENKQKRVLVVEDDDADRKGVVHLLADQDVVVEEAVDGSQAIDKLRSGRYDCMVLDLGLNDFDGANLLKQLDQDAAIEIPPVIIHTGRDLTWEEDFELRNYASSVVIKSVRSDERLLDEVSLFLHRVVAEMPEKKRQVISSLHDADAMLRGKKVLLVDDDMRALFALTKILTDRGMQVVKAENGNRALEILEQGPKVDIVLMDIMMPELDGYEAMKRVRRQERFKNLPIIALTAKAMRGDRESCIEAGANDYLSKPVDTDRLISMLRVWLYR